MQACRSESMHNLLNSALQSLKPRRDCHKFRSAYANLFLIYFIDTYLRPRASCFNTCLKAPAARSSKGAEKETLRYRILCTRTTKVKLIFWQAGNKPMLATTFSCVMHRTIKAAQPLSLLHLAMRMQGTLLTVTTGLFGSDRKAKMSKSERE